MEKLSERCQPTISWFLIVLCCIASLLLTYSILLDYPSLTKMMNGIELFIANIHILAPLFIVISISAFALEFVIAKRKDSRYQLLSLRSFIHFATCFVLTIILTLSLFIILMWVQYNFIQTKPKVLSLTKNTQNFLSHTPPSYGHLP